MSRLLELRCPSCDASVARLRRVRFGVGSPFETCPRCGTFVARPPLNEWDLQGPGAKAAHLLARIAPPLALGFLPGLLYQLAADVRGGGAEPRVLVALLVCGPLLFALFPALGVLEAIRRSRRRMDDPMYRARLVEFERRSSARPVPERRP